MLKLPNNISEDELVTTINRIVNRLAAKFRFGYHDLDDIKQQGRLLALEGLEKYDGVRPLENFLYTHVRNRLINFKRDHLCRYDKPCFVCPFYDPHLDKSNSGCAAFSDKNQCKPWKIWIIRNESKKNIMEPISIQENSASLMCGHDVVSEISNVELVELVKEHIPVALRADYFRMLNGVNISKQRRDRVKEEVLKIIEGAKWQVQDD